VTNRIDLKFLILATISFFLITVKAFSQTSESKELTGQVISYDRCNDSQYPVAKAFDNNLNTYFRSCAPFGNWIGLDLGKKCVISAVAFSPRIDSDYRDRLQLGVFEGANNPDFGDAVTLFVIPGLAGRELNKQTISCSKGFRYVRFVFPAALTDGKSSYMSELKFYGYASDGNDLLLPQITNLPTVSIHTVNAQDIVSKEEYIKGIVSIVSANGTKFFTDSLEIRGRGNNSWTHPKKPYRMKLANSTHLLDLPAKAKNWTLINSYGDKTLMRNILAYDFSRRLQMPYTTPAVAVDVVLNGDYKGCYQLCDQIDVRKNRVETDEFNPITGYTGYLVEIDAYANQEPKQFTTQTYGIPVTIKYPDDDQILPLHEKEIAAHFEKMAASVNATNYTDPVNGFRKYLDVETFLRHFLVGEYSGNTDTYWSVNMVKKLNDDKFYFGPVWDFDLGFENDWRTYSITDRTNQSNEWISMWTATSAAGGTKNMIRRILTDNGMITKLRQIYSQYRDNKSISKEVLAATVDSCASLLAASQNLNFKRWPILNTKVHENPVVYGTYENEVANVRNYILNRIDWLDKKMNYMPAYTGLKQPFEELALNVRSQRNELHISQLPANCNLKVIDMYGTIRAEANNQSELSATLNTGVYIIVVEVNGKQYTKKYALY
jgi:hypothetical protein